MSYRELNRGDKGAIIDHRMHIKVIVNVNLAVLH